MPRLAWNDLGNLDAVYLPGAPSQGRCRSSFAAFLSDAKAAHGATGFTDATENVTEKIMQMNSKVINITGRLGDEQLKDPATSSTEWEVNQKLCEEDQCSQSRAHVTVKECVKMPPKPKGKDLPPLPEGHWRDGDRECRYVKMPLAMILSDHGRCLSAASSANSISEECDPLHVNCGDAKSCNECWLLQRATENNVFTGWKLKTACGGMKKVKNGQFLSQDLDGTLKFTDEYDTQQDRQIWNLTEAEVKQMDPEELNTEIFKKPFMLENLASKRFLLNEKPQVDDDAAKTDPLHQDMANLPDKEKMPEAFKNDTAEANSQTLVRKKQWRRSFWRGVEKAGSTYLQGFTATKHLRTEDLSDDCNDRWTFVHKDRGFELKTACAKPKWLVAQNNGDGPVAFQDEPYDGPEGKWNVHFAKPPPPEPPVNEETEAVLPLPKAVPLEVEEEAAKDPEKMGSAMEMVEEGDTEKAIEDMSNPENLSNPA